MADQYQYTGLTQPGQPSGYPSFSQYPAAGGEQNAQLLQGYALTQGNPSAAMFGGQSFDQNPYSQNVSSMPVQQLGAQLNAAGLGTGFPYGDYSQFNPYNPSSGGGMQTNINDMQQFGQLLPHAFNPSATRNIYEAIAQEQGLAGFNAATLLQDPAGAIGRGIGGFSGKGFVMNQRGGMNKFENGHRSSNLPSVTNPDGLRDDTVYVSKLPPNIDHEVMKSQFGAIGKIKMNVKSRMPMIWIFKERNIPKGDALVTFEDPNCVAKAIMWFSENEFLGKKIDVRQAKNSQRPITSTSGRNSQQAIPSFAGGSNADRPAPVDMYGQFGPRGDGPVPSQGPPRSNRPPMCPGGMKGGGGGPGNNRPGDWPCHQCGNFNFAGYDQCKICRSPRPDDMLMSGPPQRNSQFPPQLSGIPAANSNQIMGPGGRQPHHRSAPMMPPPPGVRSGMSPMNSGRGGMTMRGGRGGGPIRGTAVNAGRNMRPTPY